MIFYPLIITKGIVFKSFLVDLRQIPQTSLVLLGLLAVLTPKLPVLVFFVIPMPMLASMGFLMFGLWGLSLGLGLPIGNIAHLGGLIVGVGYGFFLKKKYPGKTKMISRYFAR